MAAPWSLRSRLLGIAAVACVVAWLAGGAAVYLAVQRQDAEHFDARLQDLAHALRVFAGHEIFELDHSPAQHPIISETAATQQDRYRYQVWSGSGRLLMSSANAASLPPLMPLDADGLSTQSIDRRAFRVITVLAPEGPFRVQVAEPIAERGVWQDLLGGYLLGGLAVSAVVLGALTLLLLRIALRPVQQAGLELGRRGPLDLRAVRQDNLPREFEPVFASLNALLARVEVALKSERGFVSAAAHELRTPLSGLRAQAQLAAHPRTPADERAAALRSVLGGVDHATYLVNQLLDLARSDLLAGDPARLAEDRKSVAWGPLFASVMDELVADAAARQVTVAPHFDVAATEGSAFGLGRLLRNLLANAIAHSPEGGTVEVGTRREDGRTVLWVDDAGPGIPAAERERVFERFRRGPEARHVGCGLGLSIVKAIADAHGAPVTLGSAPAGGLAVQVRFP